MRNAEDRIDNTVQEDVGHIGIHQLSCFAPTLRNADDQDNADAHQRCAQNQPRTGFAPLGVGLIHNAAHCKVRHAIQQTADNKHCTNSRCCDTGRVGIIAQQKRGQQRTHHIAAACTAAITDLLPQGKPDIFALHRSRTSSLFRHKNIPPWRKANYYDSGDVCVFACFFPLSQLYFLHG